MRRFRGFIELAFDAVEQTTKLVERTHQGVVERSIRRFAPGPASRKVGDAEKKIAGGVFYAIRSCNAVARKAVDSGAGAAEHFAKDQPVLATPVSSTAAGTASWYVDYLQSTANGLFGDTLSRSGSRLDLGMSIRHHGHLLPLERESLAEAFPDATPKVSVFIHGLSATEWLWSHSAEEHYADADVTFGTRLQSDLGFTPVYIRYNSGRHVAENGRTLSALLDELVEAYPVPVEEIALIGHSMGGLVARSAAHYGKADGANWIKHLRHVVCIGSPHHGSPVAKAADLLSNTLLKVDAAAAQVIAELLETRSQGIRDLEHGTVTEENEPAPPVDGVGYYYVAGTVTKDPNHPVGKLFGDLLVRLPSASGESVEISRHIPFHSGTVFPGFNHFDIASHPEVYDALRDQIAGASSGEH